MCISSIIIFIAYTVIVHIAGLTLDQVGLPNVAKVETYFFHEDHEFET